jgi:ornithine carbamoyltransferase
MKNFISILNYSHEELSFILNRADILKSAWLENKMPKSLKDKKAGLWFYGNGFRNRLAFELGARAMGADVSYIPGEPGVDEPIEDIGSYLENWFSILVIRTKNHSDLDNISVNRKIPVINAKSDFNHPCEIMGDLHFIKNLRGSIEGLNVVFSGETTNICMSWFEAAVRFPIRVTQVCPAGYEAPPELVKKLNSKALGEICTSNDLEASVSSGTGLLYTDCWPRRKTAEEKNETRQLFLPYQITEKLLSRLKENAVFLPCPPVTRGEEVSIEAMNSRFCMNFKAKDHLLHCQNAIMEFAVNN